MTSPNAASAIHALHSDVLSETLYTTRLPCGLDVLVWPKRGFRKKFAACTARFGSIDNRFVDPGGAPVAIPDGIAHFLEHKLFETADGDVFDRFARLGASANAATSFTATSYFFTCTDRFAESLGTLLDFVQEPYFTEAAVEKERGIITQEIRMYDDHPDWQIFFRLLEALFQRHPVRIDIAGTAETIKAIDVPILTKVYGTFYHPSNMVAFAAGDFEPEAIVEAVANNYAARRYDAPPSVRRIFPEEPLAVHEPRTVKSMVVSRPKVLVGFKDVPGEDGSNALMRRELTTGLILDILLGKSSPLYASLYERGVIDDSFSASFTGEADHGYTLIGGETDEPERLVDAVAGALADAVRTGIDPAELERKKRKQAGRFLRHFNAPDTGGGAFLHYYLRRQEIFALLDLLGALRVEDLQRRLEEHFDPNRMATSTILPRAERSE